MTADAIRSGKIRTIKYRMSWWWGGGDGDIPTRFYRLHIVRSKRQRSANGFRRLVGPGRRHDVYRWRWWWYCRRVWILLHRRCGRVVCLAHTTTINQRGLPPTPCRDREIGVDEWPDGRGGRVKDGSLSAALMNFRGHNGATAALDAYGRRLYRGIWNASSLTERIVCLEAAGRNLKKISVKKRIASTVTA